jgi:hypothetical protein
MDGFWTGYIVGVFSVIGILFALGLLAAINEAMTVAELEADDGSSPHER